MALDIKGIHNFKTLLSWLSSELNWNTGIDDFENIEDITYDFDAGDIHLKPNEFAKITSLKQLRPLYEKQPWGIFAVEFEGRRFEVSSLRKILSGLIPKRRNRDHAVWDKKNLLFFCFWGEKNNRCFGAVYFEDKPNALPSIKTLYIAPKNEDPIYLQSFEEKFRKLAWPELPSRPSPVEYEKWHEQWTSAFTSVYRQVIRDSSFLTISLAEIALGIRKRIIDIFSVETENGDIHKLYDKFRKALIHDMTEEQFADMYAQTMVYGLFSARCMSDRFVHADDPEGENKKFEPRQAIDNIPSTNPFLQNLLKESFSRKNKAFDELDLGDITLLLQNTDTKLIIEDFNRQTGGGKEDPVIYFYEGFLNAYEKEQKKRRGVYYTPLPVVKFMVQAVDDILETEFSIKDGLASTEAKTISISKKTSKGIATEIKEVPVIQILDPAVGTATFLRQIILQIWENFKKSNAGRTKNSIQNSWNVYVKDNLLPRLNGFELMMAPYAVAHMKLALVLLDTGYAFDEDEEHPSRVNVFLTNSLEEADKNDVVLFEPDALTEESKAAKDTKKNRWINVVIGNPPYSGESANKGEWILSLLDDYKKEPGGIDKLKEKNPKWINDDYVKFIRYAQLYVERAGSGIVAYINNHSFLDNPTFRGMRWNLLRSFDKIYIIDLHGNAKKKEISPDGSKDENVFDIQQGVSINILVKSGNIKEKELAEVFYHDLYGLRDDKYEFLDDQKIRSVNWVKLKPSIPLYFFVYKDFGNLAQYEEGFSVKNLFPINGVGITTAHDNFVISDDKNELYERFVKFKNSDGDAKLLYKKFNVKEKKGWDILKGWNNIQAKRNLKSFIKEISYRPFDSRFIFYEERLVWRIVDRVMCHFIRGNNIGLVIGRQGQVVGSMPWNLVYSTSKIVEFNLYYRGGGIVFPIYLYESKKCRPNLNPKIITAIGQKINLSFVLEKNANMDAQCAFCPMDLFDYIYAVLHSPTYRETYKEFLKIDLPRIPYPTDQQVFWKLVALGGKLRCLHLLESSEFGEIEDISVSSEKVLVKKVQYSEEKVYVNEDFYFDDVAQVAWEFYIGGYQPAQKWLKDRKGCVLKAEDLKHYRKIVFALTETVRIMGEIDKVGVV
jgi:predicted helicase